MIKFLLAVLSVYALMHAFVYMRVKVLLPGRWWPCHALLLLFFAAMILAPIAARLLEKSGNHWMAVLAAGAGYSWTGFIFYAFWCFLLVGAVSVLFHLAGTLTGFSLPSLSGRAATVAVLGAVLAINIYGYIDARNVRVERFTLRTSKLPEGVERLRIAQISDVHLGLMVGRGRMADILDKVKAQHPDLLVSTGDLVDGDIDSIRGLPALFADFTPGLGKFAVIGNHEVYAGLSSSVQAEQAFGFSVLRGEVQTVGNTINIAGVDDPAAVPDGTKDETTLLKAAQNGLFTVLLKHRPDPESLGLFDLQLSGHTHYGQLYPFRYFAEMIYPYQNGPYFLGKGSVLYTSRGSGTWGPPIRVLAPPEITVVDIVRDR